MLPSPSSLGFVAWVPTAGFRWASQRELQVCHLSRPLKPSAKMLPPAKAAPFLVPCSEESHERRPGDNPSLFRHFAELDADDLNGLAAFANNHGWLAGPVLAHWDEPRAFHFTGGDTKTKAGIAQKVPHIRVETHTDWCEQHRWMRAAVAVFDGILAGAQGLRHLVRWRTISRRNRRQTDKGSFEGWVLDTHIDHALDDYCSGKRVLELLSEIHDKDVTALARNWLAETVNRELIGVCPRLGVTDKGGFVESMVPPTLIAAMWAQLFASLTKHITHRKCRSCGQWFAVGGREGSTRGSSVAGLPCARLPGAAGAGAGTRPKGITPRPS